MLYSFKGYSGCVSSENRGSQHSVSLFKSAHSISIRCTQHDWNQKTVIKPLAHSVCLLRTNHVTCYLGEQTFDYERPLAKSPYEKCSIKCISILEGCDNFQFLLLSLIRQPVSIAPTPLYSRFYPSSLPWTSHVSLFPL